VSEHGVAMEALTARMQELGLSFMSAGLATFLGAPGRGDISLFDSIRELVDVECRGSSLFPSCTRLKVMIIP